MSTVSLLIFCHHSIINETCIITKNDSMKFLSILLYAFIHLHLDNFYPYTITNMKKTDHVFLLEFLFLVQFIYF